MSLEPSVHARTHAGWTRNSWRGRRRTVTATCVEARREERREEEEEEEKGRERYKLSRSHVGIPVRPRRNNIQNWKERIRGIHSTNSLERRRGRGENLFLSRVLTAEVNPLGVRDACSGSKRDLSRETDRWTDFVLLEPRKYLEILERYGKIKVVGLTVPPKIVQLCNDDGRWNGCGSILKRSNWLGKKQREIVEGKEIEMKIVLSILSLSLVEETKKELERISCVRF